MTRRPSPDTALAGQLRLVADPGDGDDPTVDRPPPPPRPRRKRKPAREDGSVVTVGGAQPADARDGAEEQPGDDAPPADMAEAVAQGEGPEPVAAEGGTADPDEAPSATPVELAPPVELVVSEVFGPTFQGEGPSLGRRAGFVRLGRCNLDCSFCDTPYTWDWNHFDADAELHTLTVDDVVARLEAMAPEIVVITGGEPLLQQRRLVPLLEACAEHGWPVEVETNGTLPPDEAIIPLVAQWNVSPKLSNSGVTARRAIRPQALATFLATGRAVFKFVVAGESDLDEIAGLVKLHDLAPIWVMPEGTDPSTVLSRSRLLADAVLDRGWNFTTRLHTLLWGDTRGR